MMLTKRFLTTAIVLTVLLIPTGCGQDNPETPWNETEITEITVDVESIAGEDATVIYGGEEQSGRIQVPDNSLMGVVKDGKTYIYHPALGSNVNLSDETNRKAIGLFILGTDSVARTSYSINSLGMPTLEPGDSASMDMGLAIYRHMNKSALRFNVSNNFNRWAAIKLPDGEKRFIPPAGRTFDSNMCRWLTREEYAYLIEPLFDNSENPYEYFSSLNSTMVESNDPGTVEAFGAVLRGYSLIFDNPEPPGYREGCQSDEDLMELINLLDLFYIFAEGLKHIGGALIPFECIDTAFGAFANFYEGISMAYIAENSQFIDLFYQVLKEDFTNSLYNCIALAPTLGLWEIVQTFIDVIALVDWIVEDTVDTCWILEKPAYEQFRLSSDLTCDGYADVELRVSEPDCDISSSGSEWCNAHLYIKNNSNNNIWAYGYDPNNEQWLRIAGNFNLLGYIEPGKEHVEPTLFQRHTYSDDMDNVVCDESYDFTKVFFLVATDYCRELYYDEIPETGVPAGFTVVHMDSMNPCPCE